MCFQYDIFEFNLCCTSVLYLMALQSLHVINIEHTSARYLRVL